ncbi:MAG: hypothetical protein AB4372_31665 [Xenococcus sp. (in: cyanobacteria)]
MSSIKNFLAAKSDQEKINAVANLETKYSFYFADIENITNSEEWDRDTQIATIERYLESRQEYLNQAEKLFRTDFDELAENTERYKLFDYYLKMMLLVQYMGGDLYNVVERIIFLALHDDTEVKHCGSTLLLRASNYLSSYLPEILQIMSKHGISERPFKVGKVFNQVIEGNPELIDYGEEDDEFIEQCQNTITCLNSFQSKS